MTAYCGLVCDNCPIHLATLEKNLSRQITLRGFITEQIYKHYGIKLQAHEINDCDGCGADSGRLFSGCQTCEIRRCARERNLENCAQCEEYACTILKSFFQNAPEAKKQLDTLRKMNTPQS
jgi:hypothetical protein